MSRSCRLLVLLCGLLSVLAGAPSGAGVDDQEVDMTLVEDGGFTNSVGMKLVRVGRGRFLMGAVKGERGAEQQEYPQHEVELTRDFYLGETEVTQKQYKALMGVNPS